MSGFIPYGQSHDNTTRKNIDRLLHYTRHDGPLMLPVKAHNEMILIHANTLPNKNVCYKSSHDDKNLSRNDSSNCSECRNGLFNHSKLFVGHGQQD